MISTIVGLNFLHLEYNALIGQWVLLLVFCQLCKVYIQFFCNELHWLCWRIELEAAGGVILVISLFCQICPMTWLKNDFVKYQWLVCLSIHVLVVISYSVAFSVIEKEKKLQWFWHTKAILVMFELWSCEVFLSLLKSFSFNAWKIDNDLSKSNILSHFDSFFL